MHSPALTPWPKAKRTTQQNWNRKPARTNNKESLETDHKHNSWMIKLTQCPTKRVQPKQESPTSYSDHAFTSWHIPKDTTAYARAAEEWATNQADARCTEKANTDANVKQMGQAAQCNNNGSNTGVKMHTRDDKNGGTQSSSSSVLVGKVRAEETISGNNKSRTALLEVPTTTDPHQITAQSPVGLAGSSCGREVVANRAQSPQSRSPG